MKRISFGIALALSALVLAYSHTAKAVPPQAGAGTKIQVTSQTLTSQPAGKPYVIDTSIAGKVYEIAAGIDHSKVQVRTAGGMTGLSDLVRKFGLSGPFLLGSANALSAIGFGFPNNTVVPPGVVVTEVKCKGGVCSCQWGRDCDDMLKAKLCSDETAWVCAKDAGGKFGCLCVKKT